MIQPIVLSWSGGKDCSLALYELRRSERYEVVGLLTTVTRDHDRISMHGVRRELLERQARSLGLPLATVEISAGAGNQEYDESMARTLAGLRSRGVRSVAFGDLFLEEIRAYREARMAAVGMDALFPLWGRETGELARELLGLGFRAVTVCVDSQALGREFAGLPYDEQFLRRLPLGVDPCGENGEFHTFVSAGPGFDEPLPFSLGEVVLRDERFYFCDLVPA